ncbi:MAG: PRC-barrel domain-containing protein, partial [Phycisphaerae bacterium]
MDSLNNPSPTPRPAAAAVGKDYQIYYFSELRDRKLVRSDALNGGGRAFGRLTDVVFKVAEPYPEALGILVDHGWGQPTELVPWAKVVRIEADRIIVNPPDAPEINPGKERGGFAPFVDQAGWIVLDDHLIGKTILDMDGRRTEVVNDVHLLASQGRMVLIHVDISFNGFLRKWHLYGM